jgi:dihydroorotase
VIRAATVGPAAALGRTELGTFKPGAVGDASVISIEEGQFTYHDVLGEPFQGTKKLAAKGVVLAGRWWHPA